MNADPRTERAERAVRGVLAGTLGLEALMVLFVPRAIAQTGPGLTTGRLVVLLVLFALLLFTAFLVPRRAGLVLGTVLQVAVIACGVFTVAMYVLGILFLAIWVYELRVRTQLLRR
jgi:hypothetical protein